MTEPRMGERVRVRPRNGLRVQSHDGIHGRFLADEWAERVFDDWLFRRWRDGSIEIESMAAEVEE